MLTIPRPKLTLPSRLRRGVSALWNETDGGGGWPCCCPRGGGSTSSRGSTKSAKVAGTCLSACIEGTVSRFYAIDIPALANAGCTSCAAIAGRYIVEYSGLVSGICTWRLDLDHVCEFTRPAGGQYWYNRVTMALQGSGLTVALGGHILRVSPPFDGDVVGTLWFINPANGIDCTAAIQNLQVADGAGTNEACLNTTNPDHDILVSAIDPP